VTTLGVGLYYELKNLDTKKRSYLFSPEKSVIINYARGPGKEIGESGLGYQVRVRTRWLFYGKCDIVSFWLSGQVRGIKTNR
jgi:hypothetical protein